ncbi:hypothetical protein NDU88_005541 [Pleurodeles waltl]|uniref:Uncharacterized protein n=1 Tax=Pleurodeles waltl TaxID=8319 RepID=A0AAV7NPB5_PLEWA|nr:hypothetical protein NDU88_005541 [Pleurodeles waltl]
MSQATERIETLKMAGRGGGCRGLPGLRRNPYGAQLETVRLRTRGGDSSAEPWLPRLDRGPRRGESSNGGPAEPGTTQRGRAIYAVVARGPAEPPGAVRAVSNSEHRAEIGGLNRQGPTQGGQQRRNLARRGEWPPGSSTVPIHGDFDPDWEKSQELHGFCKRD